MGHKQACLVASETKSLLQAVQDEFPPGVLDMFVCDSNLHEIFFAVAGPEKTSFEGGVYVLKLALPKDYPMSPPDFHMFTPNGRFHPGAKICTSFTSFHPETWYALAADICLHLACL